MKLMHIRISTARRLRMRASHLEAGREDGHVFRPLFAAREEGDQQLGPIQLRAPAVNIAQLWIDHRTAVLAKCCCCCGRMSKRIKYGQVKMKKEMRAPQGSLPRPAV